MVLLKIVITKKDNIKTIEGGFFRMNNFEFQAPTKLIFGADTISKVKDEIPKDKKILMTYGGGSIRKNGVYKQVMEALSEHKVLEFGGIEPNTKFETLMQAVEIVKKENIDFLLSVGGGSTLDGTKFIAAAAKYEGDPWEILLNGGAKIKDAIPLGDIITLPATGSEMNNGAVISKLETKEKLAFHSNFIYPKFSIIDPKTTFSLPEKQTVNGIVDTFVHTMEQYATYDVNTPLQDEWMLGLIKTLMTEAKKVLHNPNDYEARANVFWCATCGLNYWMSLGCVQDWSTHMIGHELTALYGIDHGESLAVVLTRVWKNRKNDKMNKLAKMAVEVFGANDFLPKNILADITIKKTKKFFESLGRRTKLSDYGIDKIEAAKLISERFKERNCTLGEKSNITPDEVYKILMDC